MAKLIMLVGGSRSGKSFYAEQMAMQWAAQDEIAVYYLATGSIWDEEFAERVKNHQLRRPTNWHTIEETCDIDQALLAVNERGAIFLIDGIGSWVANLMYRDNSPDFTWNADNQKLFFSKVEALIAACKIRSGRIILVADEVGMAIVPENEQARIFRDLNGWTNQRLAQAASEVFLLSCGIPMRLK
jgi:adenosylcobinamide kinase/adenosylcobinamide-phosphate guanylyltransferase